MTAPSSFSSSDLALTERQLWHWGRGALVGGFVLAVAAACALAAFQPGAGLALPVVLGLAALGVWAMRHPPWGAALAIVLGLLLSGIADDVAAGKVVFGLYLVAFSVLWYVSAWANGRQVVVSRTDFGAALLIALALPVGLLLAAVFRNSPSEVVAHVQAFLPVLLYFPVKDACARARYGPEVIAGSLIVLGVAAAAQNAFLTQQILSSATELWQIIDVRISYGEIMLMASTLLCVGLLVAARTRREFAGLVVLFGILAAGLILTKSRGFWVATILGGLVLLLLGDRRQRSRLLAVGSAGTVALVTLALALAPDYALLLATGLAKRFLTLSSAATADLSLLNRFAENAGAWETIRTNPLLGHGWGATYSYYSILSEGTQTWGFVHNAYLGIWLKLGFWGLGLVGWTWIGAIFGGARALRDRSLAERHRALGGSAAAALVGVALVANTSSPFELADQMLVLTALWAVAQGIRQRAGRPADVRS